MQDQNIRLFVEQWRLFQKVEYREPEEVLSLGFPHLQTTPAPYALWFTDGSSKTNAGRDPIEVSGASYAFCLSFTTSPYAPEHIEAVRLGQTGRVPLFATAWDPLYLTCGPERLSPSAVAAIPRVKGLHPTLVLNCALECFNETFSSLAAAAEMLQDETGWLKAAENFLAGRIVLFTELDLDRMEHYRPSKKPPQARG